jgi:hypothetical protein
MTGPIKLKLHCSCSVPESEFYSLYYYVRDSSVGGKKREKKKKKKKEFLQYVLCLKVCDILLHNKKVSHFYSGNVEVYYFQKVDVWFSKLSQGFILDCCVM